MNIFKDEKSKKIITNGIIGSLSVALIIVGGIKYNDYSTEVKKFSAEPSVQLEKIEKNGTTKVNVTSKEVTNNILGKELNSSTSNKLNTTTKTGVKVMAYLFDKTLSANSGFSLSLIQGETSCDGFKLQIQANNCQCGEITPQNRKFTVDISRLVLIDNNGYLLNINGTVVPCIVACANNEGTKTWIPYEYNPSITSITATYTFDDGTVASTVLNLS